MLEFIRSCPFCGREATVSAMSWCENPFCDLCLAERIEAARREVGPIARQRVGHYLAIIPSPSDGIADGAGQSPCRG